MDPQKLGGFVLVLVGDVDGMKQSFLFHIFLEPFQQGRLKLC